MNANMIVDTKSSIYINCGAGTYFDFHRRARDEGIDLATINCRDFLRLLQASENRHGPPAIGMGRTTSSGFVPGDFVPE